VGCRFSRFCEIHWWSRSILDCLPFSIHSRFFIGLSWPVKLVGYFSSYRSCDWDIVILVIRLDLSPLQLSREPCEERWIVEILNAGRFWISW
jgi:hypothetical protein